MRKIIITVLAVLTTLGFVIAIIVSCHDHDVDGDSSPIDTEDYCANRGFNFFESPFLGGDPCEKRSTKSKPQLVKDADDNNKDEIKDKSEENSTTEDCDPSSEEKYQTLSYQYEDKDGDEYFVKLPEPKDICTGKDLPENLKSESPEKLDCDDDDKTKWQLTDYSSIDEDKDGYTVPSEGAICSGEELLDGYFISPTEKDCNDEDPLVWKMVNVYEDIDLDGFGAGEPKSLCLGDGVREGFSLNNKDYFPNDSIRHTYDWSYSLRSSGSVIFDVVEDEEGFIYITGYFLDGIKINSSTFSSQGKQDIYLIKLDNKRNVAWVKTFGSKLDDIGMSLALIDGGIYLVGAFSGSMNIDDVAINSNGKADTFIALFSREGKLKWAKNIGYDGQIDKPTSVLVDQNRDIVITGITKEKSSPNVFVQKGYVKKIKKEKGETLWLKTPSGDNNIQIFSAKLDDMGNVYLAGSYQGTIMDKDSQNYPSNGDYDVFIMKINSDGDEVWLRTFGGQGIDKPGQLILNQNHTLWVTGVFHNEVNFDPASKDIKSSKGKEDIFLSLITQDGKYISTHTFGGKQRDLARLIALDNNGDILLGGYSTSYGTYSGNKNRLIIMKVNKDGEFLWIRRFGGEKDYVHSLIVTKSGKLIVSGGFYGEMDFDFTNKEHIHVAPLNNKEGYLLSF